MRILQKLTIQNLKLNKKRTIVTIIGIVLSTALLTAVSGMVTSFQSTFIDYAKRTKGNFHVFLNSVPEENLKYIENNQQVKQQFYIQDIGYSILENGKNENKPYLWLREYDDVALEGYGIRLIEGRLPENKNEIILSNAILQNGGVKYHLGDEITLQIGKRILEDKDTSEKFVLDSNSGFRSCESEEDLECEEEHLEVFETRVVKVAGFMERPSYQVESYSSPGYTIISKLENRQDSVHVRVLLKNAKDYKEFRKSFQSASNMTDLNSFLNDELLRSEGVLNDGTMAVLTTVASVVVAIIIVSSVFVIKNSFTISVTERIREYGMLSSIGATKKQLRKNVLFEGFLLGIIGIPLGVFSGILAVRVLLLLLNIILGEFISQVYFVYHVPFLAILFSILLAVITIYLSGIFPARKASKIAPVEAIRGNGQVSLKRKTVRTPKWLKKWFSIGGEISYKNLKRSKKKYRTTVVSLVVSIVMFISLTALIDYGFKYVNIYYQEKNYNVEVWLNQKDEGAIHAKMQEISQFDHVQKYSLLRSVDMNISIEKYANSDEELRQTYFGTGDMSISIVSLGDSEYHRFLRHIGINPNAYQDKAVLIDQVHFYMNNKYYDVRYLNVKKGDVISGALYDSNVNVSIPVGTITKERPMGLEGYDLTAYLVVSDDMFDRIASSYSEMLYVESDHPDLFVADVEEFKNNEDSLSALQYYNLNDAIRENNAIILVLSIFLYGFIAVITLIGVTNIFNTITTNMFLRKREFAMLRSIGMTKKEFHRMIRLESILYGLKSLLIGIPIGIGLGYLIYKGFSNNLETPFVFPIFEIVLCVFFVMLVVGVTMRYSLKKIQKENIIEVIRNDNI